MNLAVLIKAAPPIGEWVLDPTTHRLRRSDKPLEPGSLDMVALGAALHLKKERGAIVSVVTMGPPQAESVLKTARQAGADQAVLLTDRALAGADTLATARALADGLKPLAPDLILAGRHSLDAETGQVGPMLAEVLNVPVATGVTSIEMTKDGRAVKVRCHAEGGEAEFTLPLPAVLTVSEALGDEAWPSEDQTGALPSPSVDAKNVTSLGGPEKRYGALGSPTQVGAVRTEEPARRGHVVAGADENVVNKALTQLLAEPAARVGPEPDRGTYGGEVWVLALRRDSALSPCVAELLGAAYRLSRSGGKAAALVLGPAEKTLLESLHAAGAEKIYRISDPALLTYRSDLAADAVAGAIRQARPDAVLVPSTDEGREVASIVAARLSLGLTGDIIGLAPTEGSRLIQDKPAFGGGLVAEVTSSTRPDMATVRPGIFAPLADHLQGTAELIDLSVSLIGRGITAGRFTAHGVPGELLAPHTVVLGVGMGVGQDGVAKVAEIARQHGFGLAASRNVTDAGWLPKAFQVGLTGRSIAPDLYIALGIAGWPEHMVGLRRAGRVVAVNSDAQAPILQASDLGIVGSWVDVLPLLVKAIA